jgi:hypothetical protein
MSAQVEQVIEDWIRSWLIGMGYHGEVARRSAASISGELAAAVEPVVRAQILQDGSA